MPVEAKLEHTLCDSDDDEDDMLDDALMEQSLKMAFGHETELCCRQEEITCGICQDTCTGPCVHLSCPHPKCRPVFHEACWRGWLAFSGAEEARCILCKQILVVGDRHSARCGAGTLSGTRPFRVISCHGCGKLIHGKVWVCDAKEHFYHEFCYVADCCLK